MPYLIRISTFNFFFTVVPLFGIVQVWLNCAVPHKQTLPESLHKDAIDLRKCDADQRFLQFQVQICHSPGSKAMIQYMTHLIATKVFAIHFHGIPFTWKDLCWIFFIILSFFCAGPVLAVQFCLMQGITFLYPPIHSQLGQTQQRELLMAYYHRPSMLWRNSWRFYVNNNSTTQRTRYMTQWLDHALNYTNPQESIKDSLVSRLHPTI